jgi:hypothetical protein
MISELSATGSWFVVGGVLLVFAYLVRVREWTFLIAGYDDSVDVPREIAASIVGNLLARVGVASFLVGITAAMTTGGLDVTNLSFVFAVVVTIDSLRAVYKLNTYESNKSVATD